MPSTDDQNIKSVERKTGHIFASPGLLLGALLHSSVAPKAKEGQAEDFERLEFLGDRVLGLVIAGELLTRFPNEREGPLAKRLAGLVDRKTLAQIAEEMELGDDLKLSKGESKAGGAHKGTVLADTLEAVIGAIYLDGGLSAALKTILFLWGGRIAEGMDAAGDPKTTLQEWAQGKGFALPVYRQIGKSGLDHAPVFEIELEIATIGKVRATGTSKREAQKEAASLMLQKINSGNIK